MAATAKMDERDIVVSFVFECTIVLWSRAAIVPFIGPTKILLSDHSSSVHLAFIWAPGLGT
jgi:hypothetical protein